MSRWEVTRPTSGTTTFGTIGSLQRTWDVLSSFPDTTTVCSFNTNSAGTGRIVWNNWQVPTVAPDSYYQFGVRISCKSMGTAYLGFDYSVNSGNAWTSLVASVGGTNLAATTITRSLAANIGASSLWIRCTLTNVHTRGRAQIWDVALIGSYHQDYTDEISDSIGVTDYNSGAVLVNWAYGNNAGISDSPQRKMSYVRGIES